MSNLPKTEQQAELRIAQSSRPTEQAVIARYTISRIIEVSGGKFILKDENPKPASIAAMP